MHVDPLAAGVAAFLVGMACPIPRHRRSREARRAAVVLAVALVLALATVLAADAVMAGVAGVAACFAGNLSAELTASRSAARRRRTL